MTTNAEPAPWIKDGAPCYYQSSPGYVHEGIVDGEPHQLGGHTWCVHLREMGASYGRPTVKAAACDCLRPRTLGVPADVLAVARAAVRVSDDADPPEELDDRLDFHRSLIALSVAVSRLSPERRKELGL